jgi:diguanylate cyclase (GGDEF)-like protein
MFSSALFRRTFLVILGVFFAYCATVYFLSVPLIRRTVYTSEETAARTILDNVYELVKSEHLAIEAYREAALAAHERELKNIALLEEGFLDSKYHQFMAGRTSEAEAKRSALEDLRGFRYGNNDYVWVSDYASRLLSHPDPKLYGADYSAVKDVRGRLIVPPMVQLARRDGEGFYSYWWKRLGEEEPVEKLTYFRNYPRWEWVLGTGVYVDDVASEVARRKERMIEELRKTLATVHIARTGYVYIFDSRSKLVVHPNPDLQGTDVSGLKNPVTGRPLTADLMAAARGTEPVVRYLWDTPADKGHFVHGKVSWVRYFQPFDWYIASSAYTDELDSTATALRNRILLVSIVMFVACVLVAMAYANRLLVPLGKLSEVARRVTAGDLGARCEVERDDEIGVLATALDSMVTQVRSSINDLDGKVRARTQELDQKNEILQREFAERERIAGELAETNAKLTGWVSHLEEHNREIAILNQMGDMLHACRTLGETFSVITETVQGLFVGEAGALYMLSSSKNVLERVASWGEYVGNEEAFATDACWAFRRGKVHRIEKPGLGQACEHLKAPPPFGSLCVPLVAQGEVLGLLHHVFAGPDPARSQQENERRFEARQSLTMTVADHLSLALANLKLRDSLRDLSVRDPLTGLFNRRYMKETLEREMRRVTRAGSTLGVVMLDVDHFKRFNDTHGHEAGDLVLTNLARVIERTVRGEDVACRFGGEEFVIVLPGATLEVSTERAERLRETVERSLHLEHHGQALRVTISLGVAAYPMHGAAPGDVLAAADAALYVAKNGGRNRVAVSGERAPEAPASPPPAEPPSPPRTSATAT